MSINSCTIDRFTIDTFCSPQRAKVLARLIHIKYPTVPTATVGGNPRAFDPYQTTPPPLEDREPFTFEQPYITVEVIFDGMVGRHTLEAVPQMHFVSVTDFILSQPALAGIKEETEGEITVNITDFPDLL